MHRSEQQVACHSAAPPLRQCSARAVAPMTVCAQKCLPRVLAQT